MDYESRVKFMSLDEQDIDKQRPFPEVHVSLILNLENSRESCMYDVLFLFNLLVDSIHIDLRLYNSQRAYGKLIFTVRDSFVSIGMLEENDYCLAVTTSEDEEYCSQIYEVIQRYANQESLLFEKIEPLDVVRCKQYLNSYISEKCSWLIGHITEKFLPDNLYTDFVKQIFGEDTSTSDLRETLYQMHDLENSLIGTVKIRMLIYNSALLSLVSQGEIEFWGYRIKLTTDQRIEVLAHILELMERDNGLEMKLIIDRLSEDILFDDRQCIFLSESSAFLRFINVNGQMQFLMTARKEMKKMLEQFYEEIWNLPEDIILSDQKSIRNRIEFAISLIYQMSKQQ